MQSTPPFRSTIFLLAAALSACGGGGGTASSSASAPAVQTPTTFQSVQPAPNFDWSTARKAAPHITLSRSSGALGPAALFVSAYSCVDLNDGSTPLTSPLGLDQFASYTLNNAQQALGSLSIDLSALTLQLPATQKYVLVELVSASQTLYSQLLTPTELGQLQITLGAASVAPAACKF